MGSQHHLKTGLILTFWSGIITRFHLFFHLRNRNNPLRNVPLPPVLPWVWDKPLRTVHNSENQELKTVLRIIPV